jgi:hypothetical protein
MIKQCIYCIHLDEQNEVFFCSLDKWPEEDLNPGQIIETYIAEDFDCEDWEEDEHSGH